MCSRITHSLKRVHLRTQTRDMQKKHQRFHNRSKKTLGYQLARVLNANMGCAPTASIFFLPSFFLLFMLRFWLMKTAQSCFALHRATQLSWSVRLITCSSTLCIFITWSHPLNCFWREEVVDKPLLISIFIVFLQFSSLNSNCSSITVISTL